MSKIIDDALGTNDFNTKNYINETINLTKSIILKNDLEAERYNEYIKLNYPTYLIDETDKTTWRYYLHLTSTYHPIDTEIFVKSLDNGDNISLTKQSLNLHPKTKAELAKFDSYYTNIVNKYPEQELYIKSVITDSLYSIINDIIALEDFTIVSYNINLLEDNEDNLLNELQDYINNYKVHKLIQYYSLSDNLFMASQLHILYTFILTTILTIRLKNVKTVRAHSYHIRNYLASHHFLDKYIDFLNKKQVLFLYRNLLYLENHSGQDNIFKILINTLFTERSISVVAYDYKQLNSKDSSNYMNYIFSQRLINSSNLLKSPSDFDIDSIARKENNLALNNPKEWEFNKNEISFKLKNSLFNYLLTKDIETLLIDNTDTVKYKLIPTLVDYIAYMLKTSRVNFIVNIVNPITNINNKLTVEDAFKLFIVSLFKTNDVTLINFPDYQIKRVFKEVLPSNTELLNLCYDTDYWYESSLNDIKQSIPPYSIKSTSAQFEEFITSIYKTNLGIWLFITNLSNKNNNVQFELINNYLNKNDIYSFGNETVSSFLTRIKFNEILTLDTESISKFSFNVLSVLYNDKLNILNENRLIQEALTNIFKTFTSYTTQVISKNLSENYILAGQKDVRLYISEDRESKILYMFKNILNADTSISFITEHQLLINNLISSSYSYTGDIFLSISSNKEFNFQYNEISNINLKYNMINTRGVDWIINPSTSSDLTFLSQNL